MPRRLCVGCSKLIPGGSYCDACWERHRGLYQSPAWRELSKRMIEDWRGAHGNWCPGWHREPHHATFFQVHHIIPHHGDTDAFFDLTNLMVVCRDCNNRAKDTVIKIDKVEEKPWKRELRELQSKPRDASE